MVVAVLIFGSVGMILPLKETGHGMEKIREMENSFGMGMVQLGTVENNFVVNWGTAFGVQWEPDDFLGSQDALAMSVDGWPLGNAGEWNDLDENNELYFVIEYNGSVSLPSLSRGFDSDAVRIFGPGYRPPTFEAKINSGQWTD